MLLVDTGDSSKVDTPGRYSYRGGQKRAKYAILIPSLHTVPFHACRTPYLRMGMPDTFALIAAHCSVPYRSHAHAQVCPCMHARMHVWMCFCTRMHAPINCNTYAAASALHTPTDQLHSFPVARCARTHTPSEHLHSLAVGIQARTSTHT